MSVFWGADTRVNRPMVAAALLGMAFAWMSWAASPQAQRRYQPVTLQLDLVSQRLAIPSTFDGKVWICAAGPEPWPCVQVDALREASVAHVLRGER